MGQPEVLIPIGTLAAKEITFRTSFRYGARILASSLYLALTDSQPGDYALAIALASTGKIDVKPMVTHRYEERAQNFHLLNLVDQV